MGVKISKQKLDSSAQVRVLSSKPYQFLDTSQVQSLCVPNMIKIFLKPRQDEQLRQHPCNGPSSCLAFLEDENCLLFGSVYFAAFRRILGDDMPRELFGEPLSFSSNCDHFCLFDLKSGEIETVANQSVRDIFISSDSKYVAVLQYSGYSSLQLRKSEIHTTDLCNGTPINRRSLDILSEAAQKSTVSHATCCSISPNGKWIVVAVCSNFFTIGNENHLEIYTVNNQSKLEKKQIVSNINNAKMSEIIIASLEFSSDSQILAAGSFGRQGASVFLVSTKTWKVILEYGVDKNNIGFIWGIFNPVLTHQLISLTGSGFLQEWDISSLYGGDINPQIEAANKMSIVDNGQFWAIISSPKFSPDGRLVAVPFSDGNVVILDPNLFQVLWKIQSPNFQHELGLSNVTENLETTSVCFSKSCEYLAIAFSGDIVCIWLLPRMHFTLKHFCRTKIISICPPNLVHKLPIPKHLQQYLLYQSD